MKQAIATAAFNIIWVASLAGIGLLIGGQITNSPSMQTAGGWTVLAAVGIAFVLLCIYLIALAIRKLQR